MTPHNIFTMHNPDCILCSFTVEFYCSDRVRTGLRKNLNLEGFLEKALKIKSALKSTRKSLKNLEKSLNSTIFCRT